MRWGLDLRRWDGERTKEGEVGVGPKGVGWGRDERVGVGPKGVGEGPKGWVGVGPKGGERIQHVWCSWRVVCLLAILIRRSCLCPSLPPHPQLTERLDRLVERLRELVVGTDTSPTAAWEVLQYFLEKLSSHSPNRRAAAMKVQLLV